MKNFPHQYTELSKFRETLSAISNLHLNGADVLDDGVLGYALARAGIYRFRGTVPDIEIRINAELQKPRGDQGARTAARDVRRTLALLGFLNSDGRLTATGDLALNLPIGSPEATNLWRQAVIALEVSDSDGDVSHPMRILLRLLADQGPLPRIETALSLEPKDDGQAEYDRIKQLIPVRTAIENQKISVSNSTLNNAVKILPALALQLGLVSEDHEHRLQITESGEILLRSSFQFGNVALASTPAFTLNNQTRRRPTVADHRKITSGTFSPFDSNSITGLSREEQIDAARLSHERTGRHQIVVGQVAAAFADEYEVYENRFSYDALLVPRVAQSLHFLLEIKTLDLDEVDQTNRAVAQLFWYSWAKIPDIYRDETIVMGVVYDRPPSETTASYLESLGIAAFACFESQITASNERARLLCASPRQIPTD